MQVQYSKSRELAALDWSRAAPERWQAPLCSGLLGSGANF